jgi:hypothetical protein
VNKQRVLLILARRIIPPYECTSSLRIAFEAIAKFMVNASFVE